MRVAAWLLLVATVLWQLLALPFSELGPLLGARGAFGALGSLGTITPNFVLLVLLYLALADRSHSSVLAALLIGAAVEAISLDPWGAHTLGYFFAVWLLRASLVESWADHGLPRLLLVSIGVTAAVTVRLCVLWLAAPDLQTAPIASWGIELIYNVAMSLPLFGLLDAFRERLVRTPHRQLAT